MKKSFQFKALTILAFAVFVSNMACGQQIPVESPFASTSGEVAGSKIEIFYHSPGMDIHICRAIRASYGFI